MIFTEEFYQKHKQFIPVIILLLYSCVLIKNAMRAKVEISSEYYDFELSIAHYAFLGATLIDVLAYFLFRKVFKYVLLATLLLGFGNMILFTSTQTIGTISLFPIPFQPAALFVILIVFLINFNRAIQWRLNLFKGSPENERRKAIEFNEERIEKFKDSFKNKSAEELNYIINENKYTGEAKEAARQLLDKTIK